MSHTLTERRARTIAAQHGWTLCKSRTRNPLAADHGTFMLVDQQSNSVVALGLPSGYGLSLEEISAAFTDR